MLFFYILLEILVNVVKEGKEIKFVNLEWKE